jgi:hypothetical protein
MDRGTDHTHELAEAFRRVAVAARRRRVRCPGADHKAATFEILDDQYVTAW